MTEEGHVASAHWLRTGSARSQVTYLGRGQTAKFGFCGCGGCDLEFRMDLVGVSGELHADLHVCRLSNLGRHIALMMRDLEEPRQRIRVPPGATVPIPFELARVGIAGAEDCDFLTVFGPEPISDNAFSGSLACRAGLAPLRLNPSATYYAVLEVLCDAWTDPDQERLPTSSEVASTLRGKGLTLSSRAVDHHIDYLIRRAKLDEAPNGWRRETLVEICVAQGWLTASTNRTKP